MMLRLLPSLLICMLVALPGCGKKKPAQPRTATPTPRAAVELTILVVDDPEIAAGINLLRGEWAERSGGELAVEQQTVLQMLDTEKLAADIVIYPTRYLGTLLSRNWLRPVRKSLLQDESLNLQDVFPLVRDRVMRLGGETLGLSLGEPPLMLSWVGKMSQGMEEGRAFTWSQCDRLRGGRTEVSDLDNLDNPLAVELIVRAFEYTKQQGNLDFLFDSQTMEPRLTEPPFGRALHDIVLLPRATASGESVSSAGLSWPTAASRKRGGGAVVSFLPVPRADEVYDRSLQTWSSDEQAGESPTYLGFSGRMASVSRSSRNAVSAFKLLKWLASGDTSMQVSQHSRGTLWFRSSQISQGTKWLSGRNVSDGSSLAATELLTGKKAFVLPRIPGIDQYLELLEQSAAKALSGDLGEEEALLEAVASWQAVTESLDTEQQRAAYRLHLGFEDSAR